MAPVESVGVGGRLVMVPHDHLPQQTAPAVPFGTDMAEQAVEKGVGGKTSGANGEISPLTGCYLLIVVGEPASVEHKELILQRITKGFLSWDLPNFGCDLNSELQLVVNQTPKGEAKTGEHLIQYVTENLVTEVLINAQVNTLQQCVKNLLTSYTRHKHVIHAGYAFSGSGSWVLQDGTYSYLDMLDALQEAEVQWLFQTYANSISVHVHCAPEGDWGSGSLSNEPATKLAKVLVNPDDKCSVQPGVTNFVAFVSQFLKPQPLGEILEPSDVVGNIRFSRPTLYVFPGGQGDSALFGVNGFNMLVDGGFSRRACFWDFVRHLDRVDALLVTRLNNSNMSGVGSLLKRKAMSEVYPHIGHVFCNVSDKQQSSPDGLKDKDGLVINLVEENQAIVNNLKQMNVKPQQCYRDPNLEPINLYHKVGHGKLDMYVVNPSRDSREVKEFLHQWNAQSQYKSRVKPTDRELTIPLPNLMSICALLVWQPTDPADSITRILFPGSSPQAKIFDGLEKLKHLDILKHSMCTEKSLSTVIQTKKAPPSRGATPSRVTKTEEKTMSTPRIEKKMESKTIEKKVEAKPPPSKPWKQERKTPVKSEEKKEIKKIEKVEEKREVKKMEKPEVKKAPLKRPEPTKTNGVTKSPPMPKTEPIKIGGVKAKTVKDASNKKVIEAKNIATKAATAMTTAKKEVSMRKTLPSSPAKKAVGKSPSPPTSIKPEKKIVPETKSQEMIELPVDEGELQEEKTSLDEKQSLEEEMRAEKDDFNLLEEETKSEDRTPPTERIEETKEVPTTLKMPQEIDIEEKEVTPKVEPLMISQEEEVESKKLTTQQTEQPKALAEDDFRLKEESAPKEVTTHEVQSVSEDVLMKVEDFLHETNESAREVTEEKEKAMLMQEDAISTQEDILEEVNKFTKEEKIIPTKEDVLTTVSAKEEVHFPAEQFPTTKDTFDEKMLPSKEEELSKTRSAILKEEEPAKPEISIKQELPSREQVERDLDEEVVRRFGLTDLVSQPLESLIESKRRASMQEDKEAAIPKDVEESKDLSKEELKEVSKEDVNEVTKEDVNEVTKEDVKEVIKEEIKEVVKEVEEVIKEEAKEMSKDEVKEMSKDEGKEMSKDEVKEISKEEIKEVSKAEVDKVDVIDVVKKEVEELGKEGVKELEKDVKEVSKTEELTKEDIVKMTKEHIEEVTKEVIKELPTEDIREVTKEDIKEVPREDVKEVIKEEVKEISKEMPKEEVTEISKEMPKEEVKEISKEMPKEEVKEICKEMPKEDVKEMLEDDVTEISKEVMKEEVREMSKEKEEKDLNEEVEEDKEPAPVKISSAVEAFGADIREALMKTREMMLGGGFPPSPTHEKEIVVPVADVVEPKEKQEQVKETKSTEELPKTVDVKESKKEEVLHKALKDDVKDEVQKELQIDDTQKEEKEQKSIFEISHLAEEKVSEALSSLGKMGEEAVTKMTEVVGEVKELIEEKKLIEVDGKSYSTADTLPVSAVGSEEAKKEIKMEEVKQPETAQVETKLDEPQKISDVQEKKVEETTQPKEKMVELMSSTPIQQKYVMHQEYPKTPDEVADLPTDDEEAPALFQTSDEEIEEEEEEEEEVEVEEQEEDEEFEEVEETEEVGDQKERKFVIHDVKEYETGAIEEEQEEEEEEDEEIEQDEAAIFTTLKATHAEVVTLSEGTSPSTPLSPKSPTNKIEVGILPTTETNKEKPTEIKEEITKETRQELTKTEISVEKFEIPVTKDEQKPTDVQADITVPKEDLKLTATLHQTDEEKLSEKDKILKEFYEESRKTPSPIEEETSSDLKSKETTIEETSGSKSTGKISDEEEIDDERPISKDLISSFPLLSHPVEFAIEDENRRKLSAPPDAMTQSFYGESSLFPKMESSPTSPKATEKTTENMPDVADVSRLNGHSDIHKVTSLSQLDDSQGKFREDMEAARSSFADDYIPKEETVKENVYTTIDGTTQRLDMIGTEDSPTKTIKPFEMSSQEQVKKDKPDAISSSEEDSNLQDSFKDAPELIASHIISSHVVTQSETISVDKTLFQSAHIENEPDMVTSTPKKTISPEKAQVPQDNVAEEVDDSSDVESPEMLRKKFEIETEQLASTQRSSVSPSDFDQKNAELFAELSSSTATACHTLSSARADLLEDIHQSDNTRLSQQQPMLDKDFATPDLLPTEEQQAAVFSHGALSPLSMPTFNGNEKKDKIDIKDEDDDDQYEKITTSHYSETTTSSTPATTKMETIVTTSVTREMDSTKLVTDVQHQQEQRLFEQDVSKLSSEFKQLDEKVLKEIEKESQIADNNNHENYKKSMTKTDAASGKFSPTSTGKVFIEGQLLGNYGYTYESGGKESEGRSSDEETSSVQSGNSAKEPELRVSSATQKQHLRSEDSDNDDIRTMSPHQRYENGSRNGAKPPVVPHGGGQSARWEEGEAHPRTEWTEGDADDEEEEDPQKDLATHIDEGIENRDWPPHGDVRQYEGHRSDSSGGSSPHGFEMDSPEVRKTPFDFPRPTLEERYLPDLKRHEATHSSASSTQLSTPSSESGIVKDEKNKTPIDDWGEPMGLPSPPPPPSAQEKSRITNGKVDSTRPLVNKADNKKMTGSTPASPRKVAKSNKDLRPRRPESPKPTFETRRQAPTSKLASSKIPPTHFYVDLAYVPHHGNPHYSNVEFFKRVRARYYVLSGINPSKEVLNSLLEAKQSWEDKDLEVTIIPTYDTDTLGYWVALNEDTLTKNKIDLAPSASRCTINLQDHETSCSAYRLEF